MRNLAVFIVAFLLLFLYNLAHVRLGKLHLPQLLTVTSLHILHDRLLADNQELHLKLHTRSELVLAEWPPGDHPEPVLVTHVAHNKTSGLQVEGFVDQGQQLGSLGQLVFRFDAFQTHLFAVLFYS